MSADLLRRAAAEIRKDQGREEDLGHINGREYATWIAVADLLDAEAANRDNYIRRQGWDTSGPTSAEIVARAYLGDGAA